MSPEILRAISIISVVVTVVAVGFAVLAALRPARVRVRRDAVMLVISLSTAIALGVIMKTRTPVEYLVAALLVGAVLGLAQGLRLQLREQDGTFLARRDILGLGAWGIGIAITQLAGLASRTGVIEVGQAVSFFGIAATGTLIVARQRELVRARSLSAAATAVAAIAPIPIVLTGALFQQAEPSPTPEPPITYQGEVRWNDIQDDWLRLGSLSRNGDIAGAKAEGYDLDSTYLGSDLTIVYDPATGEVTVDGEFDAAWPLGELNLLITVGAATWFDDEIDEQDQADIDRAREERDCDAFLYLLLSGGPAVANPDGTVDLELTGVYDTSRPPTDCVFDMGQDPTTTFFSVNPPVLSLSGLGADSLEGAIRGTWLFPEGDNSEVIRDFVWPIEASTEGETASAAPGGSTGDEEDASLASGTPDNAADASTVTDEGSGEENTESRGLRLRRRRRDLRRPGSRGSARRCHWRWRRCRDGSGERRSSRWIGRCRRIRWFGWQWPRSGQRWLRKWP